MSGTGIAGVVTTWQRRIAWAAVALALCVIVFGSFVRLSNAGLSCPDWPTCYGRATWPVHAEDVAHANANFERPVESHKAWREQVHRHLAATLGILTLTLALLAARHRRRGVAIVVGAAVLVAVSIPLYMGAYYVAASIVAIAAELALIGKAIRWNNRDLSRVATLTFAMIIFQALLGMWTVTWLLKPIVVMGHLLGGLMTLSLLLWMAWRMSPSQRWDASALKLRGMIRVGVVLLAIQIALGGPVPTTPHCPAAPISRPVCASGGRIRTSARRSCSGVALVSTTKAVCWMARRVPPFT